MKQKVNRLISKECKHSLKMFEGCEDIQAQITRNAFLFAQATLEEAKKNSLTREQIIKEGEVKNIIRSR